MLPLLRRYVAVVIALFVGLLGGLAVWASYANTSALMDSSVFCVSCHEMRTAAEEFSHTVHFSNRTGVRAECADCHVPKPFFARVAHMIGATGDILGHLTGVIDTPEKYEARRLALAKRVWAEMGGNGSRECRTCHSFEAMDAKLQRPEAVEAMHTHMADGKSCIDCHQGIAHQLPRIVRPPAPVVAAAAPAAGATTAAAPAATPPPAGGQGFISKASVALAAAPGGAVVGTLLVSAPVVTIGTEGVAAHVGAKLWLKGSAVSAGPLYAAPKGIELGRVDDPTAAKAKAGDAVDGFLPVEIEGYVAADAVVASLEPIWKDAEMNYEFTCGACHALHDPHEHTAAEWATEMPTMARNANLQLNDAMPILKWLQTESLKPKSGN